MMNQGQEPEQPATRNSQPATPSSTPHVTAPPGKDNVAGAWLSEESADRGQCSGLVGHDQFGALEGRM